LNFPLFFLFKKASVAVSWLLVLEVSQTLGTCDPRNGVITQQRRKSETLAPD